MEMNYTILAAELSGDPLSRGYATMNDAQAADSLNTVNRTLPVTEIRACDFYDAVDQTEYAALDADKKDRLRLLFSMGTMKISAGQTRAFLLSCFGAGSNTRAALAGYQTRAVSRAEELGLPVVMADAVGVARGTRPLVQIEGA